MKTILKGRLGEKIAQKFLEKRGYKVLGRNLKLKNLGEVDILAEKNGVLNFVEVKSLFNQNYFLPEFKFNKQKRQKIERLARFFCLKLNKENYIISLVAVSFNRNKIKIRYYENI
ncbi:hypothetical protein HRbin35_00526 [bacterium HR35]|nr:hypothetical protein HRbin35_00526 [bacterium HR35]